MSKQIPASASCETVIERCTAIAAGLKAVDVLAPQAQPWIELKLKARTARDERDDAREAVLVGSARLRVLDVHWDGRLLALSGHAYLAAGKDAKATPYVELFGAVPAARAVQFGPAKATAVGDQVCKKAVELGHPDLTEPAEALRTANVALNQAAQTRDEAKDELLLHDIRRRKLVAEGNELIARTEVGILTAFPGDHALVTAILSQKEPDRDAGKEEPATGEGEQPA